MYVCICVFVCVCFLFTQNTLHFTYTMICSEYREAKRFTLRGWRWRGNDDDDSNSHSIINISNSTMRDDTDESYKDNWQNNSNSKDIYCGILIKNNNEVYEDNDNKKKYSIQTLPLSYAIEISHNDKKMKICIQISTTIYIKIEKNRKAIPVQ